MAVTMHGDGLLRRASGFSPQSPAEESLRVLFDIGHPAQVHLFRNAIAALDVLGHETFVTSRHKEVTVDLLDAFGITHVPLSRRGTTVPSLLLEQLTREVRLFRTARRFDPAVIVSRLSPVPAHVSQLTGCRHVALNDTHIDNRLIRTLYHGVTLPFVDTLCVPDSFDVSIPLGDRISLDFQELAYLHPRYFEPDPAVLTEHGIDPNSPYFVIRVAGWDAYHDVGHGGLTVPGIHRLIDLLGSHGQVFISAEYELPPDLERYRLPTPPEVIHSVLYYADLYVGDSGTMSTESAILGTPSIRTNTMIGSDENVFKELEHRYGLLRSFADESRAIRAVDEILAHGLESVDWEKRRAMLLAEQPDVTERIVETILTTQES